MIKIKEASTNSEFKIIENLAFEILPEVYDPIVTSKNTDSFLSTYLTGKAIAKQISLKGYRYYLLNFKSKNVGFIGIEKKDKILNLSKLYVLKNYRGNKIGKSALLFVIDFAIKNNFTNIELIVNKQNLHSIEVYQKNGFKIIESMVNSLPNGYPVEDYKMQKKLYSQTP